MEPETCVFQWELHLSEALQVLLIRRNCSNIGQQIRISHNALSKMVLYMLLEKGCVCDVLTDFLDNCGFHFHDRKYFNRSLHFISQLICELVSKRAKDPVSGRKETKFASLIEDIRHQSGEERAVDALKQVYKISEDPFVGQQIARFYIGTKNWKEANSWARSSVQLELERDTDRPNRKPNSYLLDTLGQTHRMHMMAIFKDMNQKLNLSSDEKKQYARDMTDLAFNAIDVFREVQDVSEQETTWSFPDDAGYFHELSTSECLLQALAFSITNSALKKVLYSKEVPREMTEVFGEAGIERLKKMPSDVERVMIKLKDDRQQLKGDHGNHFRDRRIQRDRDKLSEYKAVFSIKFQVPCDDSSMTEQDECNVRRNIVHTIAGYAPTFRDIFNLRQKRGGNDLRRICELMAKNLNSSYVNAFDRQTYLTAILALNITMKDHGVSLQEMANISNDLYLERKASEKFKRLEPYLLVAMFNWPEQNKSLDLPVSVHQLKEVLAFWKDAYYKKHPRQREDKRYLKNLMVAFLGKGTGLEKFAFPHELSTETVHDGLQHFWRLPLVRDRLQRWKGILINDGNDIDFLVKQEDVNVSIVVPTSFPVRKNTLYLKEVYAVIGFTWAGPKAFDVSTEDTSTHATLHHAERTEYHKHTADEKCVKTENSSRRQQPHAVLDDLLKQKVSLQQQLDEVDAIKSKERKRRNKGQREKIKQEEEFRLKLLKLNKKINNEMFKLNDAF